MNPLTKQARIGYLRALKKECTRCKEYEEAVASLKQDIDRWCCENADYINIGCDRCKVERERQKNLIDKWLGQIL